MKYVFSIVLILLGLQVVPAEACTTFAVRNVTNKIGFVGRSYDWHTQAALVIANLKGMNKTALSYPPNTKKDPDGVQLPGLNWQAQYSSITINQYGRDFPAGGINTEGLVVETMEMDPSGSVGASSDNGIYSPSGATSSISETQWVQYLLDSFKSVDDFLTQLPTFITTLKIIPNGVYAHWLMCDTTECAAVEIKQNNLYITLGRELEADMTVPAGVVVVPETQYPPMALANDFYHCSVYGQDTAHTLALLSYAPWGGRTAVSSAIGEYNETCTITLWSDYACRIRPSVQFGCSNSVERFVRAMAGSKALSGKNVTVDDMFTELNQVFSEDTTTGGTMWQIVYDLPNRRVYWRTVADGQGSTTGFTGLKRSLGFDDVGFGDGDCTTADLTTTVVNIDGSEGSAPACSDPPASADPDTCNPNPDLPSCPQLQWRQMGSSHCNMQPYDKTFNENLVTHSITHSSIDLGEFKSLVSSIIPHSGDLKDFPDYNGYPVTQAIMFKVLAGYPDGFTQCGSQVTVDQTANMFLENIIDPYLNPYVEVEKPNTMSLDSSGTSKNSSFTNACDAFLDINEWGFLTCGVMDKGYYKTSGTASGLHSLAFASASNCGDDCPPYGLAVNTEDGSYSVKGELSSLDVKDLTIDVYCDWHWSDEGLCGGGDSSRTYMSTVTLSFNVAGTIFNSTGTKLAVDPSNYSYCVEEEPTPTADTVLSDYEVSDPSCSVSGYDPAGFASAACGFFEPSVEGEVIAGAQDVIDNYIKQDVLPTLPQCSGTSMSGTSSEPQLTASWGGIDGESVTAQVGQPIQLEAQVTADGDSQSHEFATFSAAIAGGSNLTTIGTVRARMVEGVNSVTVNWTPTTAGDKDIYFDVSRWNEQSDEVEPAVLRVNVAPASGGCSLVRTSGSKAPQFRSPDWSSSLN